jgi:HK97 family phage portal protein
VPRIVRIDPVTGDKSDITDSKLLDWVASPNQFQSWGELIELIVQGYFLSGNSFISHELVKGRFESWHLGPPSAVEVVPDRRKYVTGYIYLGKIAYKNTEVIHFKNPTLNNIYYGVPSVRPLLDTLILEGTSIQELKTFYEGSNILSGILQSEYNLSPEQIETVREQFKELYGRNGSERRGTVVLPSSMTYNTVQATPKDAMLLDTLNVSERRVFRVFKINPIALGGAEQSTSHPQELMKATFNTAVRPYLYKIQDQITTFLRDKFKDNSIVFYFDLDRITELETPLDTKANASKTMYSTGIASLNEARDLVGLPPLDVENADKHILAAYLFGENAAYVEGGYASPSAGGAQTTTPAGSTDPEGGVADMPTTNDNTSNNK